MPARDPQHRIDLTERLARKGPRKLLSIDGGGIRGVLSLLILAEIEELLVKQSQRLSARRPLRLRCRHEHWRHHRCLPFAG